MLLSNQPANTKPQQTQPPSPSPPQTQNFKSKLQQQIATAAANIANGGSSHHHPLNNHHHHHHHHNHQQHQHNISFATDFSIAAIMARGGNAPSSREPSERSLSPASVERYSGQDVDDDVDVDVVDCSDSEAPSATAAAAATAATANAAAAAAAAALQAQQQARQALRVAQQHQQQQQQHQQQQQRQQTHHHATANKQQRQHHNHHNSNTNSNSNHSKSSSHRGRSAAASGAGAGAAATPSPPPPSQSPEEIERLSPEESPAQTHVSHRSSEFLGSFEANPTAGPVCRAPGHCAAGFAEISLRLSPQLLAGGRKSRPATTRPHLRPSGQPHQPGGFAQAGRVLREGEVDKQRNGQEWTGRAELNAPIPAQDPFGPTEPWPEHTRQPQGAAGYGP
ncbi:T-box protein H15 isoform X3 [Drosophila ananassae]|uniref:T-box protein H15 isoform X3 n=1 Tax=Drosophila ananassae TaxID=7217 RepID=UPI001CFF8B13|nr:T-box protein H15 isoform X3 [Drosophila ananassae]